ncbi:MAG: site-2 protease family protein [Bacillota bacterium]
MPLGSLWGIRIRLNPLFLLFAVLWFIAGAPLELLLICLSVLLHEFAHGLAGRALGLQVKEVELYPFGGVARIEAQLELEPQTERWLAWAGPSFNLALAGAAVVLYARSFPGSTLLLFLIQANLVLAIFNLLPALPLDGGRILRSYLAPLIGYRKATEQAARLGQGLAALLLLVGIIGQLRGDFSVSLILVGIFLFFAAAREKKQAVYAFLRALGAKERSLGERGGLRGELLVVLEETRLLEVFRLFSPQRYHFVRVMDRANRVSGEITESSLIRAAMQKGLEIPIKKIL